MRLLAVTMDARKARDFGIGSYVRGLLGALARRGDLSLTAFVRSGDEALLPAGVSAVPCDARDYSLVEPLAVRRALSAAPRGVFHAPHYVVPLFPPAATVVTVHDLIHLLRPEHASPLRRAYARTMIRRALGAARIVLTVSEAVRRDLVAFFPSAARKIRVVPNGVDGRFLSSPTADERRSLRSSRALSFPYVLFLGNDKPHKNLPGLLRAWARLAAEVRGERRLVLAGGAPQRAGVRQALAREAGLPDGAVVDLGIVADAEVAPLLAEAEALVLPSFAEGFGLPVLEAEAVGTPVVCSDRGGLPEAAGDGALLVDPEDDGALSGAIARLLADGALRRTLGERGRRRAAAFTWDAAAEAVAKAYRDAAGAG